MKLNDIVYKIENNVVAELIVVVIVDTKCVFPYGNNECKIGVCSKKEFDIEKKNSGTGRQNNPLPFVRVYEKKELFRTKNLLMKSLIK